MRITLIALFFLSLFVLPLTLAASPADDLKKTEEERKAAEAKQADIEKQAKRIQADLAKVQQSLVKETDRMRGLEIRSMTLEKEAARLEAALSAKEKAFAKRREQLARSLEAMIALSRTPPEAVVAMPGEYDDVMKTAKMLGLLSTSLHKEAEAIRREASLIAQLRDKAVEAKTKAENERKAVLTSQEALEKDLKSRESLNRKLLAESKATEARIAELSKKADTLKDLIASIEREENTPRFAGKYKPPSVSIASVSKGKRAVRQPVAGDIVQRYGTKTETGGVSEGIAIAGREGATVIAPADGEVVFTGPFRGYGKMVILRHKPSYHSLMAGLGKIQVAPGQVLRAGEPLGTLGGADTASRLYFEWRANNKPIDPGPWLRGESSIASAKD